MIGWSDNAAAATSPRERHPDSSSQGISVVVTTTASPSPDRARPSGADSPRQPRPSLTERQRRWQKPRASASPGLPAEAVAKENAHGKLTGEYDDFIASDARQRAHLLELLKAKSYGCVKPNVRAVKMLTNRRRPKTVSKVSCFFIKSQSPARPATSYSLERSRQKRRGVMDARIDNHGAAAAGGCSSSPSAILRSPERGEAKPQAGNTLNLKFKLEQHREQRVSDASSSLLATTAYKNLVREVSPTRKEPLRASILRTMRAGLSIPPMLVAMTEAPIPPSCTVHSASHASATFYKSQTGHDSKQLKRQFRNSLKSMKKYHLTRYETDTSPAKKGA